MKTVWMLDSFKCRIGAGKWGGEVKGTPVLWHPNPLGETRDFDSIQIRIQRIYSYCSQKDRTTALEPKSMPCGLGMEAGF